MTIFSISNCYLFIFFSSGMTNTNSILKSRDITLSTNIHTVKSYGFSSSQEQMLELGRKEGWALKNQCFWIVVLGKTLESHLDSKEIKPVNPKGNQTLEGLILKLIYFGQVMRTANSLKKTQILGKTEGKGRWGRQRMRWLDNITDSRTWVWANSGRQWRTGKPGMLQFMGSQSQTQFSNWTITWKMLKKSMKIKTISIKTSNIHFDVLYKHTQTGIS